MRPTFKLFASVLLGLPLSLAYGQSGGAPGAQPPRATSGCPDAPDADSPPWLCVPEPEDQQAGRSAQAELGSWPGSPDAVQIALVVERGTPLRIAVDQKVRIANAGEVLHGHVLETVYVFDEPVIPAGTLAFGRIVQIAPVPKVKRAQAYANGNFSPEHDYKVEFDRLRLPDGKEIEIHTTVSAGIPDVVHLVSKTAPPPRQDPKSKTSRLASRAKQEAAARADNAKEALHRVEDEIREPGRIERLKRFVLAQSPYRRQYLREGTRFNATLKENLDFGSVQRSREQLRAVGSIMPRETLLHARLILKVSSATATRGSPVVAELTEPVFSAEHRLLLPAETRLIGQVLKAKPARSLHRNGELRVIFEHLELPAGAVQPIQGNLEGIEVDRSARMKLDEEGGAHTTDSKTRYLSTGAAILMAAAAARPDVEHGTVDQAGDPAVHAGAGASGFGLAGTLIGLAARSQPVSIAFSAYGASTSIYSNFLSRGRDVVLPKDAPLEIGLGLPRPPPQ
jgi:hypothetical protein